MVFGQLLGGMITRAGERMHDEQEKSYREDLWKKQMAFQMAADWIGKNADLATDEELNAMMGNLGTIANAKGTKDIFTHFPRLARQMIPHVVRPEQVTAPTGGGVQTMGTPMQVTTPAQELPPPAMAGQPAPATPMPARPAEMSMQAPGQQMAPQMTAPLPAFPERPDVLSADPGERRLHIAMQRLEESGLSEPVKNVIKAKLLGGVNITPYEAALARSTPAGQAPKFSGKPITGKRMDGSEFSVWMSTAGPMEIGPDGMPRRYVPQPGDDLSIQESKGTWKLDEQGQFTFLPNTGGEPEVSKVKGQVKPATVGTGTYIKFTDAGGQIKGYYNSKDPTKIIPAPPGMYGGPINEALQNKYDQLTLGSEMISMLNGLVTMDNVQGAIGPVAGRYTNWTRGVFEKEDEVNEAFRIVADLSDMLLRARSGAQINEQEYARLRKLVPDPQTPLKRFQSDLNGFTHEFNVVLKRRGLPEIPVGKGVWDKAAAALNEGTTVPMTVTAEEAPNRPAAMGGGTAPQLQSAPSQFPVTVDVTEDGKTERFKVVNKKMWDEMVGAGISMKVVK